MKHSIYELLVGGPAGVLPLFPAGRGAYLETVGVNSEENVMRGSQKIVIFQIKR